MKAKILRRYTKLPILIDTLVNKRIAMLNPDYWEDRNDASYIRIFKEKKALKTVLALCFTEASETFHHWKAFSGDLGGVCVEIEKSLLVKAIKREKGIKCYSVRYIKMNDLDDNLKRVNDLPFVKRYPYRDEKEFRIIYVSKSKTMDVKYIPIDLQMIKRIMFNPWLPKDIFKSVRQMIKLIDNCGDISVFQTTLIDNERWKGYANDLA